MVTNERTDDQPNEWHRKIPMTHQLRENNKPELREVILIRTATVSNKRKLSVMSPKFTVTVCQQIPHTNQEWYAHRSNITNMYECVNNQSDKHGYARSPYQPIWPNMKFDYAFGGIVTCITYIYEYKTGGRDWKGKRNEAREASVKTLCETFRAILLHSRGCWLDINRRNGDILWTT